MRLYLTFGTTHGALKAEHILRDARIDAAVAPKPAAIRGPCGLAVRVAAEERDAVHAVLAAARHPARQEVLLP